MLKALVLVILVAGLCFAPRMVAQSKSDMAEQKVDTASEKTASIADKTKSMEKMAGYFNIYWDAKAGKLWLEIDKWGAEFLYQSSMPAGIGSNDIGLDRGQLGGTHVVRFERSGPKVLLMQSNLEFRAVSNDADERRAVRDSFAESVLWGFTVAAEEGDRALVDATDFFLRDAHGVPAALRKTKQGNYHQDASRCALYLPRTKNFPMNTEVEATLTFAGEEPGQWVKRVTPEPDAITVREHHSLVQLPPAGYKPRAYDPRSSFFGIAYMDYATPISEPIVKRFAARHRLEKKDPSGDAGMVVWGDGDRSAHGRNHQRACIAGIAAGTAGLFDCGGIARAVCGWQGVAGGTRSRATDGAGAAAAVGCARSGAHARADAQLLGEHGEPIVGDGLSAAGGEAGRGWRSGCFGCVRLRDWRVGQSFDCVGVQRIRGGHG